MTTAARAMINRHAAKRLAEETADEFEIVLVDSQKQQMVDLFTELYAGDHLSSVIESIEDMAVRRHRGGR